MSRCARRYVGHCTNAGCTEYQRAQFVLGGRACWFCSRCMLRGNLVEERCWTEGDPERVVSGCRLHFDYQHGRFKRIAIVDNLADPVGRILVVESPIVSRQLPALALAERLLGAVQVDDVGSEAQPLPQADFATLDLDADREAFLQSLQGWSRGMALRVSS